MDDLISMDSDLDTDNLLSSVATLLSHSETKHVAAATEPSSSTGTTKSSTYRKLNFDQSQKPPMTSSSLSRDQQNQPIIETACLFTTASASSCPVTPLKKTKSCLKQTPSPAAASRLANFQVSFTPIETRESENFRKRNFSISDFVDGQYSSDLICTEKRERLHVIFTQARQELEKVIRIADFTDNLSNFSSSTSQNLTFNNSARSITVGQEELSFLKNLSQTELRDLYESECFKRKHAEYKISLLQKQNLDLEQRLTVAHGLNLRRPVILDEIERNLNEFLQEISDKDQQRSECCTKIVEENGHLLETLRKLTQFAENSSKTCQNLHKQIDELSSNLTKSETECDQLRTENENLHKSVEINEKSVKNLKEKLEKMEEDKKRASFREEETNKQLLQVEKLNSDLSIHLQKTRNELTEEKAGFRLRLDEMDRQHKAKLADMGQDFERHLTKMKEEVEQRKSNEIRRMKLEFEASLALYDEKFKQILKERDETARKLKEFERSFEENLRIMYYSVQQRLASKYYELVSEFAAPPNRPGSSHSARSGLDGGVGGHEISANDFLEKLENSAPLPSFRHMKPTATAPPTGAGHVFSQQDQQKTRRDPLSTSQFENYLHSTKNSGTSNIPPLNLPTDPSANNL